MSKTHQDDFLQIIELAVSGAEDAGEPTVTLNTGPARNLLELAKRAPKPRGHPPMRGHEQVQESVVLIRARARKKELVAGGMPKEAAHRKAAEEAVEELPSRNLSVETIIRLME